MKPVSRKALHSSSFLQDIATGPIVAKAQGSVKKLGMQYQNAAVVLYDKANLQPIAIRKPNQNGDYQFPGLNTNIKAFVIALDQNQRFNAVIQDNVVPK